MILNPFNKNIALLLGLCFIYMMLFYFITNYQLKLDYYSFYYAAQALLNGDNPYEVLIAKNLSTLPKIPVNLNPPIVLALFTPLSELNVYLSISFWFFSSIIMGLMSMILACRLLFSSSFLKKHRLSFCLVYLALFSTLMNAWIVQIAAVLGLGIIGGYYLYQQGRYKLAAIVWGIIIALKIFPGLLFFYVLRHKHYKMLGIMAMTVCVMWLIPIAAFGMDAYRNYLTMLPRVLWYGNSWNASIYGFFFRLLVDVHHPDNIILVQCLTGLICIGCIGWYLKKIYSIKLADNKNHQSFCLTVVVMLLISPLGWMYYFSILLIPILVTWSQITLTETSKSRIILWLFCVFLLNFPVDCIQTQMVKTLDKVTICSFYFYGLLLLNYLVSTINITKAATHNDDFEGSPSHDLILPIGVILGFGILLLSMSFIWRIMSTTPI